MGFTGTIVGITLTNWGNSRREEKKRIFESRRDIFLDATETLATGSICIGQLNDLARPTSDILRPFLDGLGSVFKVHLLASRETSELVISLVQQLSQSVIELTLARVPLDVERRRLDNMDQNAHDHQHLKSQGETSLLSSLLLYSDQCITAVCATAPQIERTVCAIRADLAMASYPPGYQLPFTDAALVS